MNFFGWLKKTKEAELENEAKLVESKGPVLRIMIGDKHVATLYHDSDYCLVYRPEFLEVGLAPFNIEDVKPSERPMINHCYRRTTLWQLFAERLPRTDRADMTSLLKELGISKDADPLIILGRIGSVSISKPWRLELVNGGKSA